MKLLRWVAVLLCVLLAGCGGPAQDVALPPLSGAAGAEESSEAGEGTPSEESESKTPPTARSEAKTPPVKSEAASQEEAHWSEAYLDLVLRYREQNGAESTYSLYDMDDDGIPELFLQHWTGEHQAYTIQEGIPVNLGIILEMLYPAPDLPNSVLAEGMYGSGVGGCAQYILVGDVLEQETFFSFGAIPNQQEDGTLEFEMNYHIREEPCTEEEYNALMERYCTQPLPDYPITEGMDAQQLAQQTGWEKSP